MPDFDLAIRGGTVATAADVFRADIGVREGRIVAVAERVESAARTIDASGLLVLPGGIDSHIHVSQPSGRDRDGGRLRLCHRCRRGGRQHLCDALRLQIRGQSLRVCVDDYVRLADGECHVDVAFHLIVSDPTPEVLGQELPALLKSGYSSFKVFMTYDDLVLSDRQLLEVFDTARREGALVMVHAEGTTQSAS
jgi:dihydropyrimidinase